MANAKPTSALKEKIGKMVKCRTRQGRGNGKMLNQEVPEIYAIGKMVKPRRAIKGKSVKG